MMTLATALVAAVTIAFPKEGLRIPPVSRCYVIGATDAGVSNVIVRGASVPVFRTGAWGTLVDVTPGTNTVEAGGARRTFFVESPKPVDPMAPAPQPKVYTKLEYAGDVPKPHPAGREPSSITVVVDAGHGGSDTGAVSPHGRPEKTANLLMAKAVRQALESYGYRVVMTREDDSFPALYDRPKVAHREQADAFVSIHYNAPGFERNPMEIRDHAVYAWNPIGEQLAGAINRRMAAAMPEVANGGVRHANFAVTRNPEIPSCLIETDYLTSPEGEESAFDAVRRSSIARAIASGIDDWTKGK